MLAAHSGRHRLRRAESPRVLTTREEAMNGTWLWPKLNSRQVIGSRPRTTTSTPSIISECPRIEARHSVVADSQSTPCLTARRCSRRGLYWRGLAGRDLVPHGVSSFWSPCALLAISEYAVNLAPAKVVDGRAAQTLRTSAMIPSPLVCCPTVRAFAWLSPLQKPRIQASPSLND